MRARGRREAVVGMGTIIAAGPVVGMGTIIVAGSVVGMGTIIAARPVVRPGRGRTVGLAVVAVMVGAWPGVARTWVHGVWSWVGVGWEVGRACCTRAAHRSCWPVRKRKPTQASKAVARA